MNNLSIGQIPGYFVDFISKYLWMLAYLLNGVDISPFEPNLNTCWLYGKKKILIHGSILSSFSKRKRKEIISSIFKDHI